MLAIVKCVQHKVGLYRSGITDMRPLRVVYALGELVCIADCEIAVAVDSEVAAEVDSAKGGRVGCSLLYLDVFRAVFIGEGV